MIKRILLIVTIFNVQLFSGELAQIKNDFHIIKFNESNFLKKIQEIGNNKIIINFWDKYDEKFLEGIYYTIKSIDKLLKGQILSEEEDLEALAGKYRNDGIEEEWKSFKFKSMSDYKKLRYKRAFYTLKYLHGFKNYGGCKHFFALGKIKFGVDAGLFLPDQEEIKKSLV